jgi:hypothetical protein
MQSIAMAVRENNFEILQTLIDVTRNMIEGELLQLTLIGKIEVTRSRCWMWWSGRRHVFFLVAPSFRPSLPEWTRSAWRNSQTSVDVSVFHSTDRRSSGSDFDY